MNCFLCNTMMYMSGSTFACKEEIPSHDDGIYRPHFLINDHQMEFEFSSCLAVFIIKINHLKIFNNGTTIASYFLKDPSQLMDKIDSIIFFQ